MKNFTIDNDSNNITVHGSAKEAETVPNAERFTSEAALAKLATDWPMARLVEIWNGLPGVSEVTKFKDRATGVNRIWKAIQSLGGAEPEVSQPEVETPAAVEVPEPTTATDVAPQGANVAPGEPESGNEATSLEVATETPAIDKERCIELLRLAAVAQSEYWDALRELEGAIGFDIDDPGDLEDETVDHLVEQHRERQTRKASTRGPRENSKTSQVIEMLKRPEGTTLEEIMAAMGWQKHTTRAMLSAGGSLIKKHNLAVTSEMVGDKRRYYIRA